MALSEDKELLIEAYKEQAAALRHDDRLAYNFATIILLLSFVLLGVPYIHSKIPSWLPLFGGAVLMIFFHIFNVAFIVGFQGGKQPTLVAHNACPSQSRRKACRVAVPHESSPDRVGLWSET